MISLINWFLLRKSGYSPYTCDAAVQNSRFNAPCIHFNNIYACNMNIYRQQINIDSVVLRCLVTLFLISVVVSGAIISSPQCTLKVSLLLPAKYYHTYILETRFHKWCSCSQSINLSFVAYQPLLWCFNIRVIYT